MNDLLTVHPADAFDALANELVRDRRALMRERITRTTPERVAGHTPSLPPVTPAEAAANLAALADAIGVGTTNQPRPVTPTEGTHCA